MAREEEVQYEQDNLGNERRKLDSIRAVEGMAGGDADDKGIEEIGTAETGNDLVLYSIPTHANEVYASLIHAHNSGSTDSTFHLTEATLNSAGSITSTVRRSVDIAVNSQVTRAIGYEGEAFESAIGVNSEFVGQIGVSVISDHHEDTEQATEVTDTP